MALSPRMQWPYPNEGADPWYDAFSGMVSAQDASASSLAEQQNIILSGGSSISWNATTGVVSWATPIVFNSSNSGFKESLPAGNAVVLVDNSIGYVLFTNSPTSNVSLTLNVASSLPQTSIGQAVVLFVRRGSKLFFRNAGVLNSGETKAIIDDGPGGGGGGGSGTVTSVDVDGGSTGLTFTGGPVTTSGTITASGTIATGSGGTGQTSYANGELLIGNSSGGLSKATLTAGANITITNASGSIEIAAAAGGTGDVSGPASSTANAVALFDGTTGKLLKDGSQLTISSTSITATATTIVPDKTLTINTAGVIPVTDLSLRLTSEVSGFFRSNAQVGTSSYEEGLGIAVNGRVLAYSYTNVALPLGSQTAGGLTINTGDSYSSLQIGKPQTLAYAYAGSSFNVWSEGGLLGSSGLANTSAATGDVANNTRGPNYAFMYSVGANDLLSSQYPVFSTRRARNNLSSPTAVQAGDILGKVTFEGRTTTGAATQVNANDYRTASFIAGISEQTFTSTSYGGGIGFWTIPNGTNFRPVSQPPAMWINNAGNVGINLGTATTTAPWQPTQAHTRLQVEGPIARNARPGAITANFNFTDEYAVWYVTGGITGTLPDADTCIGREYTIKFVGTGTFTLGRTSSQPIEGVNANYTMSTPLQAITVSSAGASFGWFIVSSHL